ncbi:MAG: GNAT family N-acetyltransferase [Armatimonadetes bacterium]|nr:GNAT family N-acetyltransferase [Armatimonadota bacterium]MDE2206250.1 GNAT family N-acetyltransferase [Armatimonadota bacterium]
MDQLLMRLNGLNACGEPKLPTGYSMRTASDADANELARLMTGAFPEMEWHAERVTNDLLDDSGVRTTFVIECAGQLTATATERYIPAQFPDAGYLHWVAADPAHRGLGLGRAVTIAVLNAFRTAGSNAAVLETDDTRTAALRLYWSLGFRPVLRAPDNAERWARLQPTVSA